MKVRLTPQLCVEAFVVANLGFLGVDILLAHAENRFIRPEEWLPIAFSAVATLLLAPGLFSERLRRSMRPIALAVGAFSILLGIGGMIYHLESAFFERQTLANLVYAAPFIAPLSYVGVGLLLVLLRLEPAGPLFGEWVLFLAFGGFFGNLGLSLLDHAQNAFFRRSEWIAVVAAAFATAFLAVALIRPRDRVLTRACFGVLGLEVVVGILGAVLHLTSDLRRPGATTLDRFLHGAPLFAPLLFANLAILAAIGLWTRTYQLTERN